MTAPVAPSRRAARQSEDDRPFAGVMLGLVIALSIALVFTYVRGSGEPAEARMPATDSAEAGFAREMQNHHGQAVEMAVIVRERSTDRQLREFAADMALGQQQEIGQMRAWIAFWSLPPVDVKPTGGHAGMAGTAHAADLTALSGRQLDLRFLELMIVHHQGGVAMADAVLARTDNAVVRDLAMTIKQVQISEIGLMQEFLRLRGK